MGLNMGRNKSNAADNTIINGLLVISESIRNVHISADEIMEESISIDFIHRFEKLTDLRNQDMITYKLSNLLMLAFLVILTTGENSFFGIADYVLIQKEKFEKYGLIENGKCPSHDTFRRVFSLIDANEIYRQTIQCFYDFLKTLEDDILDRNHYTQLIIDGKEIRGTGRRSDCKNPRRNTQVLNIYDYSLQTCIHSEIISEKTNEIPTAQAYLNILSLKNVVVTADALHCQRKTADIIAQKKGIYVLTVKENQPLLLQEINDRMDNPKIKVKTVERDKRKFEVMSLPRGYAVDGFTGMKTFVRMTSKKHSSKNADKRCFISNSIDENLILAAIENRWDIENGLHREKDNYLKEDRFHSTDKISALNLAVLNNLAIQIVRIYQMISGKGLRIAKKYIRCYPLEALNQIQAVMDNEAIIQKIHSEMIKIKKLGLA
jgi:predicted transposase YbfD/YdcC